VEHDMSDPVGGDAPTGVDASATTDISSVRARVLGGRYLLEERVASGGMASVWRAHDEVLARTVAVKLLHDHLAADDGFRERFRREAIAAAKLTHPNVVSLYDTGTDGDFVFLVMEFIDGSTLKDVIREQGALDIARAASIGEQVARALDYAHSRGLVHRDVKPANILIGSDGAVKVADFGIAKADQHDDLTKTGMVLGTAAYVAPEQIRGETVDGKADQYALAIVLYEALTGSQPFRGDTPVATAAQRLERDPLPLRSLRAAAPRSLDSVLMRALARDPRNRFPSTGAFADALAEFADADTGETAALVGGTGSMPRTATAAAPRATGGATAAKESFLRSEGRFLAPVLVLVLLAAALVGVGLATGVL
jgi:eukaryotic-like serine/threonine-protein kinase